MVARVAWSFTIIVAAVILWIIPFTEAGHDFKTDLKEDSFTVITPVGTTNATVQLFKSLYDDDTSSIDLYSDNVTDTPLVSSYNATSRALVIIGLTANTTRTVDVTYDIDALTEIPVMATLTTYFPFIWILFTIVFPVVALVHLWKK